MLLPRLELHTCSSLLISRSLFSQQGFGGGKGNTAENLEEHEVLARTSG